MILIEKTEIMGLEPTIRGMRNPMNSWAKSDSNIGCNHNFCENCDINRELCEETPRYIVGPNDLDLMLRLARAGSVDGKFRRMIAVYVDITAPLYWWKEFDTYKVGTVANSCSTMHKIHAKEFTLEDFSHEHLLKTEGVWIDINSVDPYEFPALDSMDGLKIIVGMLNHWRKKYLIATKTEEHTGLPAKDIWWQMIQLLPSSYNQKRTVMLNYEVLANIYQHRRNHKLDEWRKLCKWIEGLPYSEVITCNSTKNNEITAAIAKLKAEQWSEDQIANLLLSQTKKEQVKLFADDADKTPIHGGAFDVPAIMADGSKNY